MLDQSLIARQIGHNTQFDLRIVAAHQRLIAFSRHKHTTNLTSDRITVGNILQIRVHRAQSAGGGHGLLERSVDTLVCLIRGINKRLHDLLKLLVSR